MTAALEIRVRNSLDEIARLAEQVDAFCETHGIGPGIAYNLNLAFDELITNTISYGYDDQAEHEIVVRIAASDKAVEAEIVDDARAFDPLSREDPDVDADLDDREIGGLGIFFVKQFMDEVAYRREGDYNVVALRKGLAAND
ncbi:MAG: ATP-binding protein [Alphaproteobacteria bacterium]|jgi:anti-sigma regulatory factor (Ser/Thr protein kinase)|nr:ATP-binding protein [Alphaproteobacteria bacterium]